MRAYIVISWSWYMRYFNFTIMTYVLESSRVSERKYLRIFRQYSACACIVTKVLTCSHCVEWIKLKCTGFMFSLKHLKVILPTKLNPYAVFFLKFCLWIVIKQLSELYVKGIFYDLFGWKQLHKCVHIYLFIYFFFVGLVKIYFSSCMRMVSCQKILWSNSIVRIVTDIWRTDLWKEPVHVVPMRTQEVISVMVVDILLMPQSSFLLGVKSARKCLL